MVTEGTLHTAPVGQGVTHCGVPLYGHTGHEVDGATERDPDQIRNLQITEIVTISLHL